MRMFLARSSRMTGELQTDGALQFTEKLPGLKEVRLWLDVNLQNWGTFISSASK
jgi:hypothetical protein